MRRNKRVLGRIAKNFKIEPDEAIIELWDYPGQRGRFDYLESENSIIKRKDFKFIKSFFILKMVSKDIVYETQFKIVESKAKTVKKDFDFSSVGKTINSIKYINKVEVLKIHEELVKDFTDLDNPISPPGLKDENLLDSALFHCHTSYGEKIKYPTVETVGASLMFSLSQNHAFWNGNKRTAMVAMMVFLDRHNTCLNCDEDELFKISIKVADHKMVLENINSDAEIFELARWIHSNSKVMKKGERPITLKKIKQILSDFNCIIFENGKVERVVTRSFLGFNRKKTLYSRLHIDAADGSELNKDQIKLIREDLELDPENGVDADMFYTAAEAPISEFIIKYKNLLRRLSKV